MVAPTKLTPKAIKAIRTWSTEGLSLRAIKAQLDEEGLPTVSHVRIREILQRPEVPAVAKAEAFLEVPLPDDAAPLDYVRAQLKEARRLVSETAPSVRDQSFPAPAWATLVSLTMKLQDHIGEQERRLPVKPEDDPSNEQMREVLLAEVKSRVEEAEAACGALCPRCMRERGK